MSERSDLEKQVKELAASFGAPLKGAALADLKKLSNEDLRKMANELEIKAAQVEAQKEREEKIMAEARANDLEGRNSHEQRDKFAGAPLRYDYEVPSGRTLKIRDGLLKAGAEVKPDDVGGQLQLEALVEDGKVLSRIPICKYEVAEGYLVQCRGGKLEGGSPIFPSQVGGYEQFNKLLEQRAVVKRARA